MLVIGVLAANTINLGVALTVTYEPDVVAKVYIATSNVTNISDNNYYYSGSGDFPVPSYLIADNYTPTTITDPTITNAVCDSFGYYTIYIKIVNYSPIAIAANITMTKSDGTGSTNFSLIENDGINSIAAKVNQVVSSDLTLIKVRATHTITESLKFTINRTQAT